MLALRLSRRTDMSRAARLTKAPQSAQQALSVSCCKTQVCPFLRAAERRRPHGRLCVGVLPPPCARMRGARSSVLRFEN